MSIPSFFQANLLTMPVTETQIETIGDFLFWLQQNHGEQVAFPDWHLTQYVIAYRTRGQLVAGGLQRELHAGAPGSPQ